MQHTKKLMLVDPRTYAVNRYDDAHSAEAGAPVPRSGLDTEIASILNGSQPEDVKAKLYLNTIQKHRALESTSSALANSALAEKINATEAQFDTAKNIENEVIQFLPAAYHHKAKRLWKIINADSDVRWTRNQQLVYQNEVVPGSNAADIFIDLYQRSAREAPPGAGEIAQSLLAGNVPWSLVLNTRSLKSARGTQTPQETYRTPESAHAKSSAASSSSPRPRTRKAVANKKAKVDANWLKY